MGEPEQACADARVIDLAKRLEKLERQHRETRAMFFTAAGAVLLLSMALAAVIAFGVGVGARIWPRDLVRARKIQLIDSDKRVRTYMYTDRRGNAGLSICDGRGKSRASLCVAKDGDPYLLLEGPSGKSCVSVSMRGELSGVFMRDAKHTQRVSLTIGQTGASQLWLADKKGQMRAFLVVAPEDLAGLALYDEKGERRAILQVAGPDKAGLYVNRAQREARRK